MARLFPFRSEPSTKDGDGDPRVVDLEGEDADAVFSALSSTTARQIYARLDEEPGTPSDIADAIDSSIQNVRYHLENLADAGLVEVVDTWYSSRGNEMSVYATTDGPLIVTSDESTGSQLKAALSRLLGGVGALAGGSLLVQYALTRQFGLAGTDDAVPSDGGGTPAGADEGDDESNSAADDDAEDPVADDDTEGAENDPTGDSAGDSTDADTETTEDTEQDSADEAADADESTDLDVDADYNGTENATDGNGTLENISDGGAEMAEAVFATVPPGLLFFLGGLVVLLAVTIYWYWYRPVY